MIRDFDVKNMIRIHNGSWGYALSEDERFFQDF
jgi:hypothetical protein